MFHLFPPTGGPPPEPCYDDATMDEYTGTVSVTLNNYTCQRWDTYTPHDVYYKDPTIYPDSSIAAAENFCRSLREGTFFCYTTDPAVMFDMCNIPKCMEGE